MNHLGSQFWWEFWAISYVAQGLFRAVFVGLYAVISKCVGCMQDFTSCLETIFYLFI